MYSYLSKDGFMALRLDEVTRNELMKKYKAALALSYGVVTIQSIGFCLEFQKGLLSQ